MPMLEDTPEDTQSQRDLDLVKYWRGELDAAHRREKQFLKDGEKLTSVYEASKEEQSHYNILYANTETLGPALYNSTPRPVVKRRFNDEDPLGKLASTAGQRILAYLLDNGLNSQESFDDLMEKALLEALVPGRGVLRFGYDADVQQVRNEMEAEAAEKKEGAPTSGAEEGAEELETPPQARSKVLYECVEGHYVPWNHFRHGFGRRWSDVPWVAYLWLMDREELEKNFGADAVKIDLKAIDTDDASKDLFSKSPEERPSSPVAHVWEIWDKHNRKVIFIAEELVEAPLKELGDPLQLSGFFNCPPPLQLFPKISSLTPTALYKMYQKQAEELDRVTHRIRRLIEALKIRGFYDQSIPGLAKLLESDDNTMLPIDNAAQLYSQSGHLESALHMLSIAEIVPALQQLYVQRQQIKQVIFEITGIADIMRGSTQASETLGAQELKNQWGTLRLKRSQRTVAKFARHCLRLMLEIAVSKLAPETLKAMTGLPYPLQAEKAQVQQVVQQTEIMGMPVPPELAARAAEPSFEEVLALLQNDLSRSYRIDIETNSTVDAEATQDKQDMTEVTAAIGQFLSGVGPLVQSGVMPFEVAKTMLLVVVRRYRLGMEFEDSLMKMQPPAPPPDPKAETLKMQAQMEAKQAEMDMQMKQQEHAMKLQQMQREADLAEQEHQLRLQEMAAKAKAAEHKQALDERRMQAEVQAAHAMPKQPAAQPAAKSPKNQGNTRR